MGGSFKLWIEAGIDHSINFLLIVTVIRKPVQSQKQDQTQTLNNIFKTNSIEQLITINDVKSKQ